MVLLKILLVFGVPLAVLIYLFRRPLSRMSLPVVILVAAIIVAGAVIFGPKILPPN